MKHVLSSAVVLTCLIVAAPAWADDSTAVLVESTVPAVCTFTSRPRAVQSIAPVTGEYSLGNLGYTCNFQGNASLVLHLPNGTNFRNPAAGATDVGYGLKWLLPPNAGGMTYQSFAPGNQSFQSPTAPTPNAETRGALWIKLNANLTVAGTWSTTIAYTITP